MNAAIRKRLSDFDLRAHEAADLNAIISVISDQYGTPETAGPLSGMLMAIKDNLNLVNTSTTCASRILEGYRSTYTATPVQRLIDAGAALVAKTNMDEFAMGSSSEYSAFGPVRNPHDPDLVPGGSSGGSAVTVAAGLVDAALGSDTGGSVRQPAAFCGLYGLKPTYGRVSRYGLVAFASSFDQVGVFAKNTEDTAAVFSVIAGHDARDSTSADVPVEPFEYDPDAARALSIGIAPEFDHDGIDQEIRQRYHDLIAFLKGRGFEIKSISLPQTSNGIAAYYILSTAEASSNLARYDGIRYGLRIDRDDDLQGIYSATRSEGFGAEVQRRIMLGTYILSAGYMDKYYTRAQKVRRLIREDYLNAFKETDIILTPTTPTFPFPIGKKVDDPLTMYLSDVFTVPMSLAGVPALNIPAGQGSNGLPIGMQLVADHFGENQLFQLSKYLDLNFTT